MVKLLYWCIVVQTCMHGKLCYIILAVHATYVHQACCLHELVINYLL